MHTRIVIQIALATCLIGCTHTPHPAATLPMPAVPATSTKTSFVGTWIWHYGGEKEETRIKLSNDGRWRWWPPSDGVSPTEKPSQSGTWFIHQQVLVLRVEKSQSDKLEVGIAFTYDIRRVSERVIVLYDIADKHEFKWKRAA